MSERERPSVVNELSAFALTLLILCGGKGHSIAVEQPPKAKVFFGGFAFSGNADAISNKYPITAGLNVVTDDGTRFMDRQLRGFLQSRRQRFSKIELQFEAVQNEDKPLVLALGMTEEQVLQEDLGDFHKLVLLLGFELLVLDFESK